MRQKELLMEKTTGLPLDQHDLLALSGRKLLDLLRREEKDLLKEQLLLIDGNRSGAGWLSRHAHRRSSHRTHTGLHSRWAHPRTRHPRHTCWWHSRWRHASHRLTHAGACIRVVRFAYGMRDGGVTYRRQLPFRTC